MEEDVLDGYKSFCCACLSTDRNLYSLNNQSEVSDVFNFMKYGSVDNQMVDTSLDMKLIACWECFAIMKKIARFKEQVHNAQEYYRIFISGNPLETNHACLLKSLSSLNRVVKSDYDMVIVDGGDEWGQTDVGGSSHYDTDLDITQTPRGNVTHAIDGRRTAQETVTESQVERVMPQIVVGEPLTLPDAFTAEGSVREMPELILDSTTSAGSIIIKQQVSSSADGSCQKRKRGYTIEYMSEEEMWAVREQAKKSVLFTNAPYKCDMCIVGYYSQRDVDDHMLAAHAPRAGYEACRVCHVYVERGRLLSHRDSHRQRYVCRTCPHAETGRSSMAAHLQTHKAKPLAIRSSKGTKKLNETEKTRESTDGLRRRGRPQATVVGYKCTDCDMIFKNSQARKNHVARYHREGLQCDLCKKRFVNKGTLVTHLRLHEGPLPREQCPICHKMVRVIQLKYHIRRHQTTDRYECCDCDKVFNHLHTYQAHLKYTRQHGTDQVFKFPCPMCNKGYPTKEAMQDHFNYQHLGKTTHKCPICNKPIASKRTLDRHLKRVHSTEKKEKPKTHVCLQCGKAFTDNKALSQHTVIHSAERPLSCDICQQTFKQKASLYTHRKRVHKVVPAKRVVEFMDQQL